MVEWSHTVLLQTNVICNRSNDRSYPYSMNFDLVDYVHVSVQIFNSHRMYICVVDNETMSRMREVRAKQENLNRLHLELYAEQQRSDDAQQSVKLHHH